MDGYTLVQRLFRSEKEKTVNVVQDQQSNEKLKWVCLQ